MYFTHIPTGPRPEWIRWLDAAREGVPKDQRTFVKWEDPQKYGY